MSIEETVELAVKVLCDVKPLRPTRAAYLFAQTTDNQSSVLERGADLLKRRDTEMLLISGAAPCAGYPGFDVWQAELCGLDVPAEKIAGVDSGMFDSLNTLIEALAAVRHCKAAAFPTLSIVAAPFHQLRAFMTAVTALSREYPELRVFSAAGRAQPWYEPVSHSQGALTGCREDFIQTELERIEKYQAKGDLDSIATVRDYLRTRDGATSPR
ncbi:MAG: YdcF family protein [Gammaproteobacteria bacterium]